MELRTLGRADCAYSRPINRRSRTCVGVSFRGGIITAGKRNTNPLSATMRSLNRTEMVPGALVALARGVLT